MRHRLSIAVALLLASACGKEVAEPLFRTVETDLAPTRSRLTAPDIETKKTGITLGAYEDGTLVRCAHFTAALDAMPLDLAPGRSYTVYALVNMGDQTSSFPLKEEDLEQFTYSIPSYTDGDGSLAERGLPMAGKLTYTGIGTTIPVERLMAKVTADLSCEWTGAVIRSVRVCNLNRVLRPFGRSTADGDQWAEQEFQAGTGQSSGTFVFYVPENRQGDIAGIGTSADKSPDRNGEVLARSDRLTYLETVAEGSGLYAGSITYRSYLGENAVSSFDLRRNAHYRWTVRYRKDGLQENDWKHENALEDTRFLYWKDAPDEQAIHVQLKTGDYGTRAGQPWRPAEFVLGDATGIQYIQHTYINKDLLPQYVGYSIDTDRFEYYTNYRNAYWFVVGSEDLPPGDYETRFFYLDTPERYLSAWLHVRDENDLHIDDGWDDGGESILP